MYKLPGTSVQEDRATFLALGDSYTIGEGVEASQRWPEKVAAALHLASPQIIAKTGWTTDELEAAILAASTRGRFALVTLLIGVNDQYRGRDVASYRDRFTVLLGRAVAFAGGDAQRVIVVSIPDWGVTPFAEGRDRSNIAREIDAFNSANRDEAGKANARYADITPLSRQHPSMVTTDGLHPSAEMYALWTSLILQAASTGVH
jgi:lysophospholipase L1-like esterase